MKKKLLYVIIYISYISLCHAQSNKISKDSIYKLISESFIVATQGQYNKAYKQLNFALEYGKNINNDSIIGEAYNCIGAIFYEIGDYDNAEKNYLLSRNALQKANYESYLIYHYNNIAELYFKKKNYVDAEKMFVKSRNLALELKDSYKALWPIYNIANIKYILNDFDSAYLYLIETIKIYQPNTEQQPSMIINSHILLANIYAKKEEYAKAFENYKKAEEISLDHNSYTELIEIEKRRVALYDGLNQPDNAKISMANQIIYLEKNFESQQSILNEKNKLERDLFEKESSLNLTEELNKSQEQSLKKIKYFTLALLAMFIVLIGVVILLYRSNRKRLKLSNSFQEKNKELLNAKMKTEYASQLKNNFFSTISHELRTPLYAVTGITDVLINENPKKEQVNYLKALKSSGEHLLSLINNILQINKYDANKIELHTIEFDIQEVVDNLMNALYYLKKENNNTLHVHIDNNIPRRLKGDSVKLSQIIINLLGNALKFTINGNIWFNVNLINQELNNSDVVMIRISVKDDGIGISKEMQARIFDDFYQESKRLNRDYEGAGLGLAIVKRLLNAMNSKIKLESEPNVGTTFSFDLNFEYEKVDVKSPKEIINNNYKNLKNKAVLVVDDNNINQMITRRILENKSANVIVVDNGFDAIDLVKKQNFDIVLMDIHMPKMNGYEVATKIREFDEGTPIIALTAVDLNENKERILSSGMNGVISKPFQIQQFYLTISKFIH
ncbi:response regulator [Aquimarina sp. MMG016]|uniref:tetratricopeptide repeat-containing hybrid sensor histidine kinase/response regulator n=1 Tax=Aquimarina sp. MMG016 TaxID=2822690 RepID=UPI001B3A784D|nr:response regulator [Aquimarina sp. MMG016]MBQ4822827.1 response regulator [Aquimarina sp. MMG016]